MTDSGSSPPHQPPPQGPPAGYGAPPQGDPAPPAQGWAPAAVPGPPGGLPPGFGPQGGPQFGLPPPDPPPPDVSFRDAWKAKADAPLHARVKGWWWKGLLSIVTPLVANLLGLGIVGGAAGLWFAYVAYKGAKPMREAAKTNPAMHERLRSQIRQAYVMAIVGSVLSVLAILDFLVGGSGVTGTSSERGCTFSSSGDSLCWY